jgi:hypothetical protein
MKRMNSANDISRNSLHTLIPFLLIASTLVGCSGWGDSFTTGNEVKYPNKPDSVLLSRCTNQSPFTDPGEYGFLYEELPESIEEICMLIKKQLIHPVEASEMKDVLPEGRFIEDGEFSSVRYMLQGLMQRDSSGLTLHRKAENRLVVACYHHGLLLASMLRSHGIPVRIRAGFSRYYEEKANVRFGHVICEIWDNTVSKWIWVDPDRQLVNMQSNQFELPAGAWINLRDHNLPGVRYTSSLTDGSQAILHILLLDLSFVLGDEHLYWHTPQFIFTDEFSLASLTDDQLNVIDKIAELMTEPGKNKSILREMYNQNEFLHPTERSLEVYYEKMTGESLGEIN